tara:strand:- start:244 stop:450 length:207 start_codon:yes stop_codon:yes gene_type:complete
MILKKMILIVDDNEIDILVAAKNLEMSGRFSSITVAKNEQEPTEIFNDVSSEILDYTLLDINTPVMDG